MGKTSDARIGLTLGLESAVVTVASSSGSRLRVVEVGRIGFPPGAVGPDGPANPEVVTSALRELWSRIRMPSTENIAVCLNHPAITLQLTAVPVMPDRDLDSALHGIAEGYGIFEGADIVSDWALVERLDGAAGKLSVLLVAAKKQLVSSLVACVEAAGIKPAVVDILPTAVMRVLYPALTGTEPVAAVLVGDHATYIGIFQDGSLKVSYTAGIGQIGGRKHGQELTGDKEVIEGSGPKLPTELVRELRNSFRFFRTQFPQQNVSKVLLIAGGERSPEAAALSAELGVPVEAKKTSDFLLCEGDIVAAADTLDALGGIGAAAGISDETGYPLTISLAPKRIRKLVGALDIAAGVASIAIVLVVSLLLSGSLSRQAAALRAQARENNTATASLKRDISKMEEQLKLFTIRSDAVKAKIEELRRSRTIRLSQVVAEISSRRPQGVWLESIGMDAGKLMIKGKTVSNDAYANFIDRLSASPLLEWATPSSIGRDVGSTLFSFEVAGRVIGTSPPVPPKPATGRELP